MDNRKESVRTKERSPLEHWTEQGVERALRAIRERFEGRAEREENLPYHGVRHTRQVIERAKKILAVMNDAGLPITERTFGVGVLAAAFHDTVQDWDEETTEDGGFANVRRKRRRERNEAASGDMLTEFMRDANTKEGAEVFSEADITAGKDTITATIPDFDTDAGTVFQPHLTRESSNVALAIALADLGTAGMEGGEAFLEEGDALFREENLDILRALEHPETIDPKYQEYYKSRMLAWTESQSGFAAGRKKRLDQELAGLPAAARDRVSRLFDKFDESVAATREAAERRAALSFLDLAKDMGYELPAS